MLSCLLGPRAATHHSPEANCCCTYFWHAMHCRRCLRPPRRRPTRTSPSCWPSAGLCCSYSAPPSSSVSETTVLGIVPCRSIQWQGPHGRMVLHEERECAAHGCRCGGRMYACMYGPRGFIAQSALVETARAVSFHSIKCIVRAGLGASSVPSPRRRRRPASAGVLPTTPTNALTPAGAACDHIH